MARKSSVKALPKAVRDWLDQALLESNFSGYRQLEDLLRERGFEISKSSLQRYGAVLDRRMAAIRASTEAARLITDGASDDQDSRSEAVIALVQTELFEHILNLQEATDENIDPQERLKLLSAAAKNIATLTRASVNQKRFRLDVQEKAKEAADRIEKIATKGGLSADSVQQLRREILGIAS